MTTTVFFNLVTLPYTTTNNVEVRLYKTSSPNAVVATQSKPAPHPQHTWSFPGLDRTNYIVRIFDMAIVPFQIGEDFTVIPDNDTIVFFEPLWIEFDVTINSSTGVPYASGTNTFTNTDWIGRDIIFDRKGADTQDATDITWDKVISKALLQQPGDEFQPHEKWFLEFLPLVKAGASVGVNSYGRLWSERMIVAVDTILAETDIAKKIIIKGASNFLTITLPSLALSAEDTQTWFESGRGSHLCVKIIADGSDLIDYNGSARNVLYLITDETFEIYKEVDSGVRWRVQNMPSQYKHVGKFVSYYRAGAACIPASDATYNIRSYARLYEEFVKNLGSGQVCAFSAWSTGNNKYKFSLADTETDSGVFHVPDLRGLFERNSDASIAAAVWEDFMMEDHFHFVPLGALPSPPFGAHSTTNYNVGQYNGLTNSGADRTTQAINTGTGALAKLGFETRPVNYRTIKGILI